MKLNKNSINELRKVAEEELRTYEKSELVKIDRKILEMLLFDYTNEECAYGICRYPAWTGPFLRKIDLSEISFAATLFDAEEIIKCGSEDDNFIIDLSGTNAAINFMLLSSSKAISKCDFSNMDLSEADFNYLTSVSKCKFNNSKINFDCITKYNDLLKKSFANGIWQGAFDGAYINGKRILTAKEKKERAENIRKKYEILENNTKKKIIKSIRKK